MKTNLKWVILTGGTRGIGRGIARYLAAQGYPLVLTYRNPNGIEEQVAELEAMNVPVRTWQCDLSKAEQIDTFATEYLELHGAPYGLVCCAGMTADGLSFQMNLSDVKETFQVNLFSTMQLISRFAMPMGRANMGRIVLMSSVSSRLGNRGNSVYSATKGALQAYMRSILEEFSRRGVTVNAILPGFIDTEMTQGRAGWQERIQTRIPAQRLGTVDDVAHAVSFLLSDHAGFVNGTELTVDGGMSATLGLT